jgi:cysteine synthase A
MLDLKIVVISCVSAATGIYYLIQKYTRRSSCRKRRSCAVINGVEGLVLDTPMIRIKSLSQLTECQILGKAEFLSVTGSPKGRLALAMVEKAEKQGLISPDSKCTLFEGTVGSTGIALAIMARAKGYNCHIVMPGLCYCSFRLLKEQTTRPRKSTLFSKRWARQSRKCDLAPL